FQSIRTTTGGCGQPYAADIAVVACAGACVLRPRSQLDWRGVDDLYPQWLVVDRRCAGAVVVGRGDRAVAAPGQYSQCGAQPDDLCRRLHGGEKKRLW